MWVKMDKLTVGQEIIGIRDNKSIYYCQGMRVSAIDENSVIIRHPHGDLEYVEDPETKFWVEEEK